MAKNTTEVLDASAEATPEPTAHEVVTPQPRRRGLIVGGVVAAGVLAAGLLFAGGVLLGTTLPDDRPPGFSQGQLRGGPPPQEGEQRAGEPRDAGPRDTGPRDGEPRAGHDDRP